MRYITYYPPFKTFPTFNEDHVNAWQAILECEGKKLHKPAKTPENIKKCMTLGKGVGLPVLVVEHNGEEEYIGYHYGHLVSYLQDNGLQLC